MRFCAAYSAGAGCGKDFACGCFTHRRLGATLPLDISLPLVLRYRCYANRVHSDDVVVLFPGNNNDVGLGRA